MNKNPKQRENTLYRRKEKLKKRKQKENQRIESYCEGRKKRKGNERERQTDREKLV